MPDETPTTDLFIIGGGINGCGIARDAVGRGLSVTLAEMNDLASATSSSSTKLFHGGLRYLEFFEFRLVREALEEREVLLRAMPHISWPMRFVLPYHKDMRFESTTNASRLLTLFMPWMKGRRPAWMIRLGLFLYDHLGGRKILPGTKTLALEGTAEGAPLDGKFRRAYEYSDCWVQDSRLVVLNARDAQARGATILPRTQVISARRGEDIWEVTVRGADGVEAVHRARCLVNAGGPWVSEIIHGTLGLNSPERIRLVRGSHIVTRRLYDHDKCYFFQGERRADHLCHSLRGRFHPDRDHRQGARGRGSAPGLHRGGARLPLRLRQPVFRQAGDGGGRGLDLFRGAAALR